MVVTETPPSFIGNNQWTEANMSNEEYPKFPMMSSLMAIGGRAAELIRKDLGSLMTWAELVRLDAIIAGKNISRLITTGKITRTTQMSSFALAPAAAFVIPAEQVDQPVEAYIDCEEGVGIDAITLHPDGGTPNGGVYCSDNEGIIHPAFLKCKVVVEGGHYIGEGQDICWDDNQALGLNFEPFTRNGPLYSPAPIMPPASPELTATPSPQSSTPEVEEKPSKSLENMDDHSKNALKVAVGALVSAAGLALLAIIYTISTGGAVKGSGSVSASSTQESILSSPPSQEQSTHNTTLGSSAGDEPSFEEELAERWARVFRLIGRLSKPTVRPDEKDN